MKGRTKAGSIFPRLKESAFYSNSVKRGGSILLRFFSSKIIIETKQFAACHEKNIYLVTCLQFSSTLELVITSGQ